MDFANCQFHPECYANPNSNIMKNYAECLNGSLTEEEEIWSDRIVKAWTNFAIHG